jgi:hypothetical protein
VLDGPPEGGKIHDLTGMASAFTPDYAPEEMFEVATKLYKKVALILTATREKDYSIRSVLLAFLAMDYTRVIADREQGRHRHQRIGAASAQLWPNVWPKMGWSSR